MVSLKDPEQNLKLIPPPGVSQAETTNGTGSTSIVSILSSVLQYLLRCDVMSDIFIFACAFTNVLLYSYLFIRLKVQQRMNESVGIKANTLSVVALKLLLLVDLCFSESIED